MTRDADFERFERAARVARAEAPERLDVSAAVIARVLAEASAPQPLLREAPLVAAAGVSLLAAAVVLAVASPWIRELLDPMVELVQGSQELLP